MWKSNKKEDERAAAPAPVSPPKAAPAPAPVAVASASATPVVHPKTEAHPKMADIAHIGKSVVIRGELSGSEDLYLDGEVEGSIDLKGHSLTIGPNGHIRANLHAQEVVIHGRVDGNIRGTDRVELKKTAVLAGDIFTLRIMIEDGAFFKGAIDIQKADARPEPKMEPRAQAVAAPSFSSPTTSSFTPAAQTIIETK
ncbi:MAG TPA: polymer-forming cytoskeletal protein [Candidatus Koribacter sp.]